MPSLSFFFLSFLYRWRISKRVFVSCSETEWRRGGDGDGGRNGKTRIVFPDCIFTSHSSLCALTSIACPFSIHVHYEITGSLYEIHLPLPSSRRTRPSFDILPFPFVSLLRLNAFRCENKSNPLVVSYPICTRWLRIIRITVEISQGKLKKSILSLSL